MRKIRSSSQPHNWGPSWNCTSKSRFLSLLASRHSGEFRMSGDCLPVSVCPTARLLAASSTSLIIWGAGTCHNQCPLQPAMHLCFWTTCSKLFQSFKSKKERPQTSNIETLHLPPSGCIRTNIIPRSKDWTNGRPFSKVYIWPHTNYFENEKSLHCLEQRETSNIDLRGGYGRSC